MIKNNRYILLKYKRKLLKSLLISCFIILAMFTAFPVIQSVYSTANTVWTQKNTNYANFDYSNAFK